MGNGKFQFSILPQSFPKCCVHCVLQHLNWTSELPTLRVIQGATSPWTQASALPALNLTQATFGLWQFASPRPRCPRISAGSLGFACSGEPSPHWISDVGSGALLTEILAHWYVGLQGFNHDASKLSAWLVELSGLSLLHRFAATPDGQASGLLRSGSY